MFLNMYNILIILLTLMSLSLQSLVKWLPDASFNLPINFKNGKLPCSKQMVIFPERLTDTITINSDVSIAGFVLPMDGELVLDGTLSFGPDLDSNCTDDENVYYIEKSKSAWNQPDVWSSSRFNKATPDAERVPCFDDIVMFPEDLHSSVMLPEIYQSVRELHIGNKSYDTIEFINLIISGNTQSFILNSDLNTGVMVDTKACQSRAGCPCQKILQNPDCSVKFCPIPSCAYPVKPTGNCCKICGGFILFDVDEAFDIMSFSEIVANVIESYGSKVLAYHIGRLPKGKVQLVIVDKDDYQGLSAEVINAIDNEMHRYVQGAKYTQISGSPLSKSGTGAKIFICIFFTVIFVMGTIYVYYYKIPDIRFPLMGRSIFSRIQRRTDSVVSLTRRDSSIMATNSGVRTAFRNPLYDSRRGRVQVEEFVTEN